jgi:undecaprenyl-diphosphatase
VIGRALQKPLQTLFASAAAAAAFLVVNGVILLAAERRRIRPQTAATELDAEPDARLARLSFREALLVGLSQAAALVPGISRSGVSMGGGLLAGLSNEDAARFAFLLATPLIGAAAVLKLPELLGSSGAAIRGPALVGAVCAGLTTFFAVRYLLRFFETSSLRPFGIYCIVRHLTGS